MTWSYFHYEQIYLDFPFFTQYWLIHCIQNTTFSSIEERPSILRWQIWKKFLNHKPFYETWGEMSYVKLNLEFSKSNYFIYTSVTKFNELSSPQSVLLRWEGECAALWVLTNMPPLPGRYRIRILSPKVPSFLLWSRPTNPDNYRSALCH